MRMISATEWVLDGPHAFVCDDCQVHWGRPHYYNRARGVCGSCKREGWHQVYRTGRTGPEVVGSVIALLVVLGVMAGIAYGMYQMFTMY